ncbi:MAG: DNA repair protein RecN [Deltaproteobacteria bacterium]|jgi:DNA repair protein RecN (Recombination protein N)|nr:DNA repair protein RecN [Deltaproteobacteria bacterium]
MLTLLQVKNLAIVESLTLGFGPGANILTGETGAGKSILAGALSLVRGAKATQDMVRAGASELTVEALFHLENPEAFRGLFEAQGLEFSEELIVRRTVSANGKSRAFLNGSLLTLPQLARWGEELLAISSQHEQQTLLKPARQLEFLDAFGKHGELLARMAEAHKERTGTEEALAKILRERRTLEEQKDFREFQLEEIARTDPRPGEDDELMETKNRAKDGQRLKNILDDAVSVFYGDGGLLGSADRAASLLAKASGATRNEDLDRMAERLKDFSVEAGDMAKDLGQMRKALISESQDLDALEERLSRLQKIKRKHGPTLDDVLRKKEELENAKNRLDTLGLEEQALKKKLREKVLRAGAAARELHGARAGAGKTLAAELAETLTCLGFPGVETRIDVRLRDPENPGAVADASGCDVLDFLFCPNPGEGLKPLSRIASGGELSRVMLALKTAQEPRSDQTLVFDEIDGGLSGDATGAAAAKMAELSARQQVFVITHQPLMAAIPGKHFLARKNPEGGRTLTSINELDGDSRLMELARMLDGSAPSPQALELSKRLLGMSGENVNNGDNDLSLPPASAESG